MNKDKILALIHCKETVRAIVSDYDCVSLVKNEKEIVRFYIKDLLFMEEIIRHFVKPHSDRAYQLSDAFYPREFGM